MEQPENEGKVRKAIDRVECVVCGRSIAKNQMGKHMSTHDNDRKANPIYQVYKRTVVEEDVWTCHEGRYTFRARSLNGILSTAALSYTHEDGGVTWIHLPVGGKDDFAALGKLFAELGDSTPQSVRLDTTEFCKDINREGETEDND